jgi:quercetin dioxygenase-like cupin family protein
MGKINPTIMIKRDGLKVVRLQVEAGGVVPEHSANAHVVIVPIKGEGTFTMNKVPQPILIGEVIEMEPNMLHSVEAKTDLELMVIQMQLASTKTTA